MIDKLIEQIKKNLDSLQINLIDNTDKLALAELQIKLATLVLQKEATDTQLKLMGG